MAGFSATTPLMYCSNAVSGGCTRSISLVGTAESGSSRRAMRAKMLEQVGQRTASVISGNRRPVSRRIGRARTVSVVAVDRERADDDLLGADDLRRLG